MISNTNLSYETTKEHIIKGDKEVSKLSKDLNIPHAFTVCTKNIVDEVKDEISGEVFFYRYFYVTTMA